MQPEFFDRARPSGRCSMVQVVDFLRRRFYESVVVEKHVHEDAIVEIGSFVPIPLTKDVNATCCVTWSTMSKNELIRKLTGSVAHVELSDAWGTQLHPPPQSTKVLRIVRIAP